MVGGNSEFLAPMDIYAFAMCCVEILTNGSSPWPLLDDGAVRHLVLSAFDFIQLPAPTDPRPSAIPRGEQKAVYPES